jgi:hypothetical protein
VQHRFRELMGRGERSQPCKVFRDEDDEVTRDHKYIARSFRLGLIDWCVLFSSDFTVGASCCHGQCAGGMWPNCTHHGSPWSS